MLVLTLKLRASPELVAIWVVDEHVKPESSARNLGELSDTYVTSHRKTFLRNARTVSERTASARMRNG